MRTVQKWRPNCQKAGLSHAWKILFIGLQLFGFMGCAGKLQSKVSPNLSTISPDMTIAILPVETTENNQQEAARLFRQSLYANLEQSQFRVMERYLVDALLEQNHIAQPEQFKAINPIRLGEILGADAILLTTLNTMDRTYVVVHSSIELGVSVKMMDTRTGEILWMADQRETEYDGIAKIPTGITAAALAPVQLVTNKINLHRLTYNMTEKLTALLKKPESAQKGQTFESIIIAGSAAKEIQTLSNSKPRFPNPDSPPILPILSKTQPEEPDTIFTIQVGAYKTREHALQVLKALTAKGYKVYLYPAQTTGQTLYKVHVEKFKSHEEAVQYGHELARREHLEHFITRFQPG